MKKSVEYDCKCVERILRYIRQLKEAQEHFEVNNSDDLVQNDLCLLATAQIFTNIYETKKNMQESTLDKMPELGKVNLRIARNIASHDYESLDLKVVYNQVIRLLNIKLSNELEAFINANRPTD